MVAVPIRLAVLPLHAGVFTELLERMGVQGVQVRRTGRAARSVHCCLHRAAFVIAIACRC